MSMPVSPGGQVFVRDEGAVRVIELSRPGRKNALDRAMLAAVMAALPSAPAADAVGGAPGGAPPAPSPRAVVLAGDPQGGAFSAGFDLQALDEEERARGADPIDEPASALEASPVPVIAAIEGPCFGGALELACACDLRIAARGSTLCMPPARIGLGYALGGLARFVRLVGPARARRLFLLGDPIGAEEAFAIGLVDALAEPGQACAQAITWGQRVAHNAPLAIRAMRAAIAALGEVAALAPERVDALAALRAQTLASRDLREGIAAFQERRAPSFEGR